MTPYYHDDAVTLWHGDALEVLRELPDTSVDCCVTSPPYFGLRDYGVEGQYGLEASPAEYVETMRALFAEVRRVLADDGTLWLNLGDSYNSAPVGKFNGGSSTFAGRDRSGHETSGAFNKLTASGLPAKNLMGIPWRVAFALQDDGWILRNDIIWAKPNAMPESVTDRLSTKHEHLFMFAKSPRYWFDLDSVREQLIHPDKTGHTFGGNHSEISRTRGSTYESVNPAGRNPGDVWTVATQPFAAAHFAVMPQALASRAIQAGCKPARGCDCEQIISTPIGEGDRPDDPSLKSGRRGMNRPRRDSEGDRPITRRQQRSDALQLKASSNRDAIESEVGPAFAHYIRTDPSGARPLPEHHRAALIERGWLREAPPCVHEPGGAGIVLDPFSGSGTTGLAAAKHGRKYVGIDLSSDYLDLSLKTRLAQSALDFEEPA